MLTALRKTMGDERHLLRVRLGEVEIYLDDDAEETYFDLHPGYTASDLNEAVEVVTNLGYDLVDDEGEGIEELDNGAIRQWLARTYSRELVLVS